MQQVSLHLTLLKNTVRKMMMMMMMMIVISRILLWSPFFIYLHCIINQNVVYLTTLSKAKTIQRRHSFFKINAIHLRNLPRPT